MESKTICQCCLSTACYKDTNSEYFWAGKVVIYSNLLRDTYNISMTSEGYNYICDNCVMRLQDAFLFREQVVEAQLKIQKLLYCNKDSNKSILSNDELSVLPEKCNNSCQEEDFLWEIDKASDILNNIDDLDTMKLNNNISDHCKKANVKCNISTCDITSTNKEKCSVTSKKSKRYKIRKEIRDDSLKLLNNSNICLFKSLKTKYQCYSCKETFINISDLRTHSETHKRSNEVNLSGHSFKNADISSLRCKLCSNQCNDINKMKIHLENAHEIKFMTTDIMFVPYRLEEGFQCVICGESFNTFVPLSTHMNIHSTNNVCEICGVSFINRLSLRTHIQSMHRVKNCTLCSAKFNKNYDRIKHMKSEHNVGTSKRYCILCDKTFCHSYMLVEHKIKDHGVKRTQSDCSDCGKSFLTQQNLKVHIRSVHKMERNHQCDICGMRFFTKRDETRHKRRHDDFKSYSCSYCDGKFKSEDSRRRHLRKLHSIEC